MSQLRTIVERIERLEVEIADLNSDKRDIYAEAKGNGFDVKALKTVIAYRRKDPTERQQHDAIVETYLAELAGKSNIGTDNAPRARARAREEKPVSIAAGTAAPAQQPVQRPSDFPSTGTEKLRQQLQASVAAESKPYDAGPIPQIILDARKGASA